MTKHGNIRKVLLSPICRQHGHLYARDYFFGFPFGKPYCTRCGANRGKGTA